MFQRYAIYYTPPPGQFAQLGAAWLGWDLAQGKAVPHPEIAGIDVAQVTERPRKYGLHGTIKAPFFLANGATAQGLSDALAAFCAARPAVEIDGLKISQIGRFLALTPMGDLTMLNGLAADVMQSLDHFRAPIGAAELARKNTPNLSAQQQEYLHQWGYPHVLEHFRFHITLTGPLGQTEKAAVQDAVSAYFGSTIPSPYRIDALALCGETKDGRFQEISRFALGKGLNRL